jgi:hypothetical protein
MLIFISNRDWQDKREVGLIFGKMQSIILYMIIIVDLNTQIFLIRILEVYRLVLMILLSTDILFIFMSYQTCTYILMKTNKFMT